jgi:hypothetical protein
MNRFQDGIAYVPIRTDHPGSLASPPRRAALCAPVSGERLARHSRNQITEGGLEPARGFSLADEERR